MTACTPCPRLLSVGVVEGRKSMAEAVGDMAAVLEYQSQPLEQRTLPWSHRLHLRLRRFPPK